jgi:hypothetical protein
MIERDRAGSAVESYLALIVGVLVCRGRHDEDEVVWYR